MKVKYIKSAILAGILLTTTFSCKKVLDPSIEYAVDATNIKTIKDLEQVLHGGYARMRAVGYLRFGYVMGVDMGTDNFLRVGPGVNNNDITTWVYNAASPNVERLWLAPYGVVAQANLVINSAEKIKEGKVETRNRIVGQAYAMRAMAHFDLMRYFAVDYDRNSSNLGVSIVKVTGVNNPNRNTVKECYDSVFEDLTKAEELLSIIDKSVNEGSRKAQIDVWAVRALRARIALYAGLYSEALEYSNKVIQESGIPLASTSTFNSVFKNDLNSTDETIFAVAFDAGQGSVGNFPGDGNPYSVSNDWKSLFGGTPTNDVRYSITFSSTSNSLTKFSGRGSLTNGEVDTKVIRIAELYLVRAEANFRLNNLSAARTDVRTLRSNRITGYVSGSDNVVDILGEIEEERRKELIAEGHRWFDLRRYNKGIDRGARVADGGDCTATAPDCALPAGDKRFVYPIPLNEIKANPNYTGKQNPGW